MQEQKLKNYFSKRPRKKDGDTDGGVYKTSTTTTTGWRRRYPEANHVCVVRRNVQGLAGGHTVPTDGMLAVGNWGVGLCNTAVIPIQVCIVGRDGHFAT
jgi:hypothetical protein